MESGLRVPTRLWLIILAGCATAGLLDAFQNAMQGLLGPEPRINWPDVLFGGMEWLFLALLTLITFHLGRRVPLRRPGLGPALTLHALGALLLCIGWATLGVLLRHALGTDWDLPFSRELASWTLTSIPWSFFMYFAVLGTVHAFAYYVEARDRELQASQLSGQLSQSRLQSLRAQLQPHFLFNTLNAITVLVRDQRTPAAVAMLDRLSELLREVLRTDQVHEIPLAEELQLVRHYVEIEQVRFSDRLRIDFTVAADTRAALVPPLILQPLVENAVRHGLQERADDAVIEIGARREGSLLVLWVRDNGRGLGRGAAQGVGLDNTRARLAALYGTAGSLELQAAPDGGVIATIQLPYHDSSVRNPAL